MAGHLEHLGEPSQRQCVERRPVRGVGALERRQQGRLIRWPPQRRGPVRGHDPERIGAGLLRERLGEAQVERRVGARPHRVRGAQHEQEVRGRQRIRRGRERLHVAPALPGHEGTDARMELQRPLDGERDADGRGCGPLRVRERLSRAAIGEVRERDGAKAGGGAAVRAAEEDRLERRREPERRERVGRRSSDERCEEERHEPMKPRARAPSSAIPTSGRLVRASGRSGERSGARTRCRRRRGGGPGSRSCRCREVLHPPRPWGV